MQYTRQEDTEGGLTMGLKQSPYGRQLTLTLPSGIKVRARRPSIMTLVASGGFPSELTVEVWKLIKKDALDPDKIGDDAESIKSWTSLVDAYIPHVLINPSIVCDVLDKDGNVVERRDTELTEDEQGLVHGQVNIRDITDMDKNVVFLFGNNICASDEELAEGRRGVGGAALAKALLEFRKDPARGDAGPGGEAVRPEAEQPVGVGPDVAAVA
jgi:hypothetical protein